MEKNLENDRLSFRNPLSKDNGVFSLAETGAEHSCRSGISYVECFIFIFVIIIIKWSSSSSSTLTYYDLKSGTFLPLRYFKCGMLLHLHLLSSSSSNDHHRQGHNLHRSGTFLALRYVKCGMFHLLCHHQHQLYHFHHHCQADEYILSNSRVLPQVVLLLYVFLSA